MESATIRTPPSTDLSGILLQKLVLIHLKHKDITVYLYMYQKLVLQFASEKLQCI